MKIQRIYGKLGEFIEPNKVLVIYGPRRIGKTTMIRQFLDETETTSKYQFDTGSSLDSPLRND